MMGFDCRKCDAEYPTRDEAEACEESHRARRLTLSHQTERYGRDLEMSVERGICNICGETRMCLWVDASEGEYVTGKACKPCLDAAFESVVDGGP